MLRSAAAVGLWFVLAAGALAQDVPGSAGSTPLDAYVRQPDATYRWEAGAAEAGKLGTYTDLALTSQTWHEIVWRHGVRIYEPPEGDRSDAMLLFITGGGTDSRFDDGDDELGFGLAKLTGARVAVLPQVPNQPLLGDKKEDTLIAETFVRYLESKDATWPLLFPMVKSAVRAMDALQVWGEREGRPVKRFVVTGGSKRGWTTWLTGAVDPRVIAIAPMVIDVLNFPAQKVHWDEVYGGPTDQVADYTRRGLVDAMVSPEGKPLWAMVDPYSFRDRLMKPKLIVLGTNDPYWSLDALNLYWDGLKGPKHVVYVPNAGHGLEPNREYALRGIAAIYRHATSKKVLPVLRWEHGEGPGGSLLLEVAAPGEVKSARAWVATAPTRDFRQVRWESRPMEGGGPAYRIEVPRPSSGYVALWGDVEYAGDGVPFHLATQIRQAEGRAEAAGR